MNTQFDEADSKTTRRSARVLCGKFGKAYLALSSVLYASAGLLGLLPNGDFFASAMWHSHFIVTPFPLHSYISNCLHRIRIGSDWTTSSCSIYDFRYLSSWEPREAHFTVFSLCTVLVACLSLWAALNVRIHRFADLFLVTLLAVSALAAGANVAADLANWGMYPYRDGHVSDQAIFRAALVGSYAIAYVLARVGTLNTSSSGTG
jgi:hypothetical protein